MPDLNLSHFRSIQGITALAEIALQIMLMMCLGAAYQYVGVQWFTCIGSFICVLFVIFCYLLKIYEKYEGTAWGVINLIVVTLWVLPHFIMGISCAQLSQLHYYSSATGAASFFHFASSIVFGFDAALYFMMLNQEKSTGTTSA